MPVVVPQTKAAWTNGVDAMSSTNLNTYLRDPLKFIMSPPIAELRRVAAQSIPSATGTAIAFDSETVDTDPDAVGGHSTVTNTTRYTARYPGWYQISGGVSFASNATGRRGSWWLVNGSGIDGSEAIDSSVSGSAKTLPAQTHHVYLAEGSYVELIAYQDSGGSLGTSTAQTHYPHASIRWVSV